jgi:hypothetical protein
MPAVAVHFIDLQKRTNDLVMGTHGRGVIIIDDISPLRELTTENLAKEFHFFPIKPATMDESNGFGGTASETQFVGANASTNAKITYYLKKRHTLGKMTAELQDMSGNKIADLDAGKSKGINVIEWGFTTKAPKIATGKTFAFGGFTSPRVPAGTYKVVIQKGKETFTNELVVQYDPKSAIALADRKENEVVTRKLFDMTQELAYMVYEIDETIKAAEEQKAKSPAASKAVTPLLTELNKLKETLVITTGDNYVGAGEPQLREDLSELYSKVASTFFKPSNAELDNMAAITERMQTAKTTFKKVKEKHTPKLNEVMNKNNMQPIILKSFDEFVKTN